MLEQMFIGMALMLGGLLYGIIGVVVSLFIEKHFGKKTAQVANIVIFTPLIIAVVIVFMEGSGDVRDYARGR